MKQLVKIIHFITLFIYSFVNDFFMFVDQDLGVGLGMLIWDVIAPVLNLVVSIVSMAFMRADVRNLIPVNNYFDGAFRMTDLKNLDIKDEMVAKWIYDKKPDAAEIARKVAKQQ